MLPSLVIWSISVCSLRLLSAPATGTWLNDSGYLQRIAINMSGIPVSAAAVWQEVSAVWPALFAVCISVSNFVW